MLTPSAQHYRYWVIWRCPTVRFLDYQKVKDAERRMAAELFGTAEEPTALASKVSSGRHVQEVTGTVTNHTAPRPQIMGLKSSRTFDASSASNGTPEASSAGSGSRLKRIKLTDKERARLQEMIRKADSLQEIIRLEKELNEGRLPSGVLGAGDEMEE